MTIKNKPEHDKKKTKPEHDREVDPRDKPKGDENKEAAYVRFKRNAEKKRSLDDLTL